MISIKIVKKKNERASLMGSLYNISVAPWCSGFNTFALNVKDPQLETEMRPLWDTSYYSVSQLYVGDPLENQGAISLLHFLPLLLQGLVNSGF